MKNVVIVGCGYIGKALAKKLSFSYSLACIVRSQASQDSLLNEGFMAYSLEKSPLSFLADLLISADIIIVCVASKTRNDYISTYLDTALWIKSVLTSTHPYLIYTSSTSVYAENTGSVVTEDSPTSSESILRQTEEVFLSLNMRTCILRLGEIYGPGRDFRTKLMSKANHPLPGTGRNPTNMVHLEDITGALLYAIEHKLEGVFNLVDDDHPLRKKFYETICRKYALPIPKWDASVVPVYSSNKVVDNSKIKKVGYQFQFPHRIVAID